MRSFANAYARKHYSRDWLAAFFARREGTTALYQMRVLQKIPRDDLIAMLRDIIRDERRYGRVPSNSVRAAYLAERLARLRCRKTVRLGIEEIEQTYSIEAA